MLGLHDITSHKCSSAVHSILLLIFKVLQWEGHTTLERCTFPCFVYCAIQSVGQKTKNDPHIKVPKTCILSFGQLCSPRMVVRKAKNDLLSIKTEALTEEYLYCLNHLGGKNPAIGPIVNFVQFRLKIAIKWVWRHF